MPLKVYTGLWNCKYIRVAILALGKWRWFVKKDELKLNYSATEIAHLIAHVHVKGLWTSRKSEAHKPVMPCLTVQRLQMLYWTVKTSRCSQLFTGAKKARIRKQYQPERIALMSKKIGNKAIIGTSGKTLKPVTHPVYYRNNTLCSDHCWVSFVLQWNMVH